MDRARITAPSLLQVSYPDIRPVEAAAQPPDDPNVMFLGANSLILEPGEPVGVDGQITTGVEDCLALLWLGFRPHIPIPPGPAFNVRFSGTFSPATTAYTWATDEPTYASTLPSGRYALVGMEFYSATAAAARILLPRTTSRPGTLAQSGTTLVAPGRRTAACFYDGSFGVMGIFDSFDAPKIEALCTGSDTTYTGYLRVVRIGDIPMAGKSFDARQATSLTAGSQGGLYTPCGTPSR